MFVRIVQGNRDNLYECRNVRSTYDAHKKEIILVLEGAGQGGGAQLVSVLKDVPEEVGIYYMNNEGKTIDTVFRKDEGPL